MCLALKNIFSLIIATWLIQHKKGGGLLMQGKKLGLSKKSTRTKFSSLRKKSEDTVSEEQVLLDEIEIPQEPSVPSPQTSEVVTPEIDTPQKHLEKASEIEKLPEATESKPSSDKQSKQSQPQKKRWKPISKARQAFLDEVYVCRKHLKEKYADILSRENPIPLMAGVVTVIAEREGFSKKVVSQAISPYFRLIEYQKKMIVGAVRYNLEGKPEGVVTEEVAKGALKLLARLEELEAERLAEKQAWQQRRDKRKEKKKSKKEKENNDKVLGKSTESQEKD